MTEFTVSGIIDLTAQLVMAGEDLSLTVTGGEAHIGSVSVAIPRPSLTGSGMSATVSTFNLTGHKDNAVGDMMAARLAKELGKTCVVCCGIHVDDADSAAIGCIMELANKLLEEVLGHFRKECS